LETPEERPKTFRAEVLLTAAGLEDSLSVYKENIIVYFAKTDSLNLPTVGEKIIFSGLHPKLPTIRIPITSTTRDICKEGRYFARFGCRQEAGWKWAPIKN
jgi:hypothetical protein